MGPQVQPKCFRHLKHMRNNWELRKRGYLIRFGHTEALLLKKKDIKRPFFPPCRNWPICPSLTLGPAPLRTAGLVMEFWGLDNVLAGTFFVTNSLRKCSFCDSQLEKVFILRHSQLEKVLLFFDSTLEKVLILRHSQLEKVLIFRHS